MENRTERAATQGAGRQRVALAVEYDGAAFKGWQVQLSPALRTVQGELERALSKVANHPVRVNCAGRTDAGVHASAQVVHFEAPFPRPQKAWVKGGNAHLPPDIRVQWAVPVALDFHARFSATARRYRYVIHNQAQRSALLRDRVTHWPYPLDAMRMHEAGQALVGEHDFSAYRGASCQSRTPMRNVIHLDVQRHGDFIVIDIKANAFLLHMVRNIVGVLLEIGEGRQSPQWAGEVLASRDRRVGGITAAPDGLYLVAVDYPQVFALPAMSPGPVWLAGLGL